MESGSEPVPPSDSALSQFQENIDEFLPLLRELANIRQSGSASGSLFSILKAAVLADVPPIVESAIRTEAVRAKGEQTTLLSGLEQKLVDGFAGVTSVTNQLQQGVFDLEIAKNATERALGAVTDSLTSLSSDASKLKSEIRLKAEAVSLNEVIEQMSGYTLLRHTERIESALRNFPSYEDYSRISDRIAEIDNAMTEYAKLTEVREGLRNVKSLVQETVRDLVSQDTLIKAKVALEAKHSDIERAVERVKRMVESQEESISLAVKTIKAKIEDKPWMKDVDAIAGEVSLRTQISDFEALRTSHEDLVAAHRQTQEDFRGEMEAFDAALERFDEVILLKASREDLQVLTIQVNDPAPVVAVSQRVKELEARVSACEGEMNEGKKQTKEVSDQIEALIAANRAEDLSVIKERIHELKEMIGNKVDQEDIFLLREQKGDREDSDILHTNLQLHHKQLEQVTVLLTAVLRTMMKDSDSRHQKQQQREYLLKLSETLNNWVAGFDTGTYHEPMERKDLWSPRDTLRGELSTRTKSPKETPRLPLLATSRMRAKHGRVHSQVTQADGKWPFELPKLRQDVL